MEFQFHFPLLNRNDTNIFIDRSKVAGEKEREKKNWGKCHAMRPGPLTTKYGIFLNPYYVTASRELSQCIPLNIIHSLKAFNGKRSLAASDRCTKIFLRIIFVRECDE